jgi:CHAT domain-containing protein
LTLWDVHDLSTEQFMTSFYARLTRGAHLASALQDAMRDLRSEYPHPYYWAPFILTGKPLIG